MLETSAEGLLNGAIDLHYHCYPDLGLGVRHLGDLEMLQSARDAGMRAVVLKSHSWPTASECYQLQPHLKGIQAVGSITLNVSVGGLNPWAVELAAQQGARVVWMPTWSADFDWSRGGFSRYMKGWLPSLSKSGLKQPETIVDSSGQIRPEVSDIVRMAKELRLVIGTGHISPEESLALAKEAERLGFASLIFTHPVNTASLEQISEMANRGAFIELTASNAFWASTAVARTKLHEMAGIVARVGAEHCVLSTDSFFEWTGPPSDFLRMFMGSLLVIGVDREDIVTMVQRNPANLLDLPLC